MLPLFRVYSDISHGYNGPTAFAPAAAIGRVNQYHAPTFSIAMKDQLALAMSGKKTAPQNPFVFFTPSPLLALQFAHFRQGGFWNSTVEPNICITCFDAEQAQTPQKTPVRFICIEQAAQMCGIEVLDNGVPRSHLAEYMTLDCVVLDESARTASFKDILDAGLYTLYPAIQEVTNNTKFAPRVNIELRKLRSFSFFYPVAIRPCNASRIDLAAKIAATFKLNGRGFDKEKVACHMLALMLSLTKRDALGLAAIAKWLDENTYTRPADLMEVDSGATMDTTTMPEVRQFFEIMAMMSNVAVANLVLSSTSSIRAKDNEKEVADWRAVQHIDNAKYAAERKIKQAAKAAAEKEKNAMKKGKEKKKRDDEAAKRQRERERRAKKLTAEKKTKAVAKAKRERIKAGKEKEKTIKEKKEEAALKKELAAEKKIQAGEKKIQAAQKKIKTLEKKLGGLGM